MSSLNDLLNPESSYESSLRLQAVRSPTTSTTSPTEKPAEPIKSVEIRPPPPPRTEIIIRAHEPHPDCPDTLACLPDTDGRPQHTLPVILRCTILGSPRKRLTIREIYAAMERKYPYYKTAGPAWKQSVRHHLSLNRLFERQPRPPSDPGFGSYWTVNLDAPPGTKPAPVCDTIHCIERCFGTVEHTTYLLHCYFCIVYDDDDDDEMDWEEDGAGGPFSDEDYSGSEDMPYQYDPRHHNHNSNSYAGSSHRSYSASQAQPGRSVLHGAFSSFSGVDHPESTIERLKMEMAGLRRQSQDAVTASLRLSDELRASQEDAARAKEEATRSKAALKVAENMLEEEAQRRIQAEKTLEEETRRRLAAEDALRQTEEHLRQYQAQAQAQRKSSGYSARS
ncbi:hypothetical protein ACG7TL_000674 [Trametes sanguinea]